MTRLPCSLGVMFASILASSIGLAAGARTVILPSEMTAAILSSPSPGITLTRRLKAFTSGSFAAASLKKTFTDIGEQFKTDNPGWSVDFTFAGSSDLVTQLTQGATADVFASADTKNMDKASKAGLLSGDHGKRRQSSMIAGSTALSGMCDR